MTNNTTTTAKVASRKRAKLPLPPKTQKPYSRIELAQEFYRLTGEQRDPGYLADISNGARLNKRIGDAVKQAIANLEAKAAKAEGAR